MSIIVTYSYYRHEVKKTNATTRQFPIATPIIVSTTMISRVGLHIWLFVHHYRCGDIITVTQFNYHHMGKKLKHARKSINIE